MILGGLHERKTQFQSSYRKSQHAASTHTLLWGVTRRDRLAASSAAVSTYTPLWGATSVSARGIFGDRISTHTPPWGVTSPIGL